MKKTILLLILSVFYIGKSQNISKNDTVQLDSNQIELVKTFHYDNPRLKPKYSVKRIDRRNNNPLNGLYKIISDSSYYVTNYKNGFEDNSVLNFVKYYKNETLTQIDVKGFSVIGSFYFSVPEYNCNSKVYFDAFTKDYENDKIVDKIRIYQKIKKKAIYWKIHYPDKKVGKIGFKKDLVNICN